MDQEVDNNPPIDLTINDMMADERKGWIMYLPYLVREKIFLSLPGESLHLARQVCSFWNNYIKEDIWGNRLQLIKDRLESNWRTNRHLEETDYYDLTIEDCYIDALSANKVVVRTPLNTTLETARIQVFDVNRKTFWQVPEPFNPVLLQHAKYNAFCVVTSDKLLGIRTMIRGDIHVENLQVWNNNTGMKLFDENVVNLNCFHTSKEEDPDVLILMTNYVEVWMFLENGNIVKRRILAPGFAFKASYIFPYIVRHVQYEIEGENGFSDMKTRVTVYKHTKAPLAMYTHLTVEDLDNYWHTEGGERLQFTVEEIAFLGEFFLVACLVDLPCGRNKTYESLAIRTMTPGGTFIRQISFSNYDPEAFVTFFVAHGRLILTIDDEALIYKESLEELGKKESGAVKFKHLSNLNGQHELVFTKFGAREIGISTFLDRSAKYPL